LELQMHAALEWLRAGSPAHWMLVAAALWVGASFILSKYTKVRSNTLGEAIFNRITPWAAPLLRFIPVVGTAAGARCSSTLDSPHTVARAGEPERQGSPVSRHDFAPWAIFWIACVLAFGLVFGAIGCAAGAGGLRQACTNADTLMTGGYQLATASMKDAQRKGTAKALLGCFEDFVGSLDGGREGQGSDLHRDERIRGH
jgi:hypothetical protein